MPHERSSNVPSISELYSLLSKNKLQSGGLFADELWYSRLIGRRISIIFTKFFLELGWHPMQVTFLCFVLAGLGLTLMSFPHISVFLFGFLLFHLYIYLDSTDGEMARYLNKKSQLGKQLDKILHMFTKSALFIALGVFIFQSSEEVAYVIIGFIGAYLSLLASALYHLLPATGETDFQDQIKRQSRMVLFLRKAFRIVTGDIEMSLLWALVVIIGLFFPIAQSLLVAFLLGEIALLVMVLFFYSAQILPAKNWV